MRLSYKLQTFNMQPFASGGSGNRQYRWGQDGPALNWTIYTSRSAGVYRLCGV
jgi:hypothetical protein